MKKNATLLKCMPEERSIATDRRLFSYTGIIPERRSGFDRRDPMDRRQFSYTNFIPERRSGKDRRGMRPLIHPGYSAPDRSLDGKWALQR